MDSDATFLLNGQRVDLTGSDPCQSLLRWLHGRGLQGSKEGCGDGDCGACTVAVLEAGPQGGRRYRAINSCLLPIGLLPGGEVTTVEALADGEALHPVQQALIDHAGSQCGYCTPGFVMSLFAGYYGQALDDRCIEGNLCRCTGYRPIRAAMAALRGQSAPDDVFARRLQLPAKSKIPAQLGAFHHPDSIEQALTLKAAQPDAAWLAGATDLGVELSHGRSPAPAYIALDRIPELQVIRIEAEQVRIGAAATLDRVQAEVAGLFPVLDQMLLWFAGQQIRNRATLGGNLGTASPIGDLLPVLLALDAEIECRSVSGTRRLPIEAYFLGYRKTALAEDELITSITLPRRTLRSAAYKVAKRATDDISVVAAAFALGFDAARRVSHVRLAYGGVAATPLRALQAEALLLGQPLTPARVEAVCQQLRDAFVPLDDHRGSAAYRRELCANLFSRFVDEECGEHVGAQSS